MLRDETKDKETEIRAIVSKLKTQARKNNEKDWDVRVLMSEITSFENKWLPRAHQTLYLKECLMDVILHVTMARGLLQVNSKLLDTDVRLRRNLSKFCSCPGNLAKIIDSHPKLFILVGNSRSGLFGIPIDGGDLLYMEYDANDLKYIVHVLSGALILTWNDEQVMLQKLNNLSILPFELKHTDKWSGIIPMQYGCEESMLINEKSDTFYLQFIKILVLVSESSKGKICSGPVIQRTMELRKLLRSVVVDKLIEEDVLEGSGDEKLSTWEMALLKINS
jgi:hypothetical protein